MKQEMKRTVTTLTEFSFKKEELAKIVRGVVRARMKLSDKDLPDKCIEVTFVTGTVYPSYGATLADAIAESHDPGEPCFDGIKVVVRQVQE